MPLAVDPYVEFFLNSKSTIVQFETIEISHPNFSQTYRIVRNKTDHLTAFLETGIEVTFLYYPLKISQRETVDDLDYGITIELGDLGEILPTEIDRIAAAGGFHTKPICKYRTYRSDDLSGPMVGPITLEIQSISFDKFGAKFDVTAPRFNVSGTGLVYKLDDFPMLRGALV